MKIKSSIVVASIFGAFSFAAQAASMASVSQTFTFPVSFSDVTTSSSQQIVYFTNPANAVATVLPFNAALGILNSVQVDWDWGGSFSGVTGASGGSASFNMAGSTYLGGVSSGSNGAGQGNGAGPNTPFSWVDESVFVDRNFTAAGAGVSYDPAIWSVISGNSSYVARNSLESYSLSYTGLASGTFTSNAALVVTYNYTAAAVPEPSACALLGLGAIGLVVRRRRTA